MNNLSRKLADTRKELIMIVATACHIAESRILTGMVALALSVLLTNHLDATFVDSGEHIGGRSGFCLFSDFDGDGDLDAFVEGEWSSTGGILLNDGTGRFEQSGQTFSGYYPYTAVAGDLNGNGASDLIISKIGENCVLMNDGTATFALGSTIGSRWGSPKILGDLDGDLDLDLVIGYKSFPHEVWLNDGSGTFSLHQVMYNGNQSVTCGFALADLDGDNDLDLFMANEPGFDENVGDIDGEDEVWFNDGSGGFSDSGQRLGGGTVSRLPHLADLDGDHDTDVCLVTNTNRCLGFNDGAGYFSLVAQENDVERVLADDLDGDGDVDIVNYYKLWRSAATTLTVSLNDGSGVFTDSGQEIGNSGDYPMALGDLDGDNDLDLFVVNPYNNDLPNRIFMNEPFPHRINYAQDLAVNASSASMVYTWRYDTGQDSWTDQQLGPYTVPMPLPFGAWHGMFLYDYDGAEWTQGLHSVLEKLE